MTTSAERPDWLSFDVSTPMRGWKRLELPDLHGALRIVAGAPLFETWLQWLSPEARRSASRHAAVSVTDRRGRTVEGELRSNRGFEAVWRRVEADDFSSVQVGAAPPSGHYMLSLIFISDVDTGLYLDRWAGLRLQMRAPSLVDGVPAAAAGVVADVMADTAVAIDGKLGAAHWHSRRGPGRRGTYVAANYKDPAEPERIPGPAWTSILPPLVVEALGGCAAVEQEAPASSVRTIRYADGATGALVQVTPTPQEYADRQAAWADYLQPVLEAPE